MNIKILELLEDITAVRANNMDLSSSILSVFRLLISNELFLSARFYILNIDLSVKQIVSHGDRTVTEEEEKEYIINASEDDAFSVKNKKIYLNDKLVAVFFCEGIDDDIMKLLSIVFSSWITEDNYHKSEQNQQVVNTPVPQNNSYNAVGISNAFEQSMQSALKVANSNATVLIYGETGTGKEVLARTIQENSARSNKPFITVNCGALSESLLDSELFGHAKGAFTGAIIDSKGKFELANTGTIFLDEIGDISPAMQVKLLRVLQEMEIVRVGESKVRKLDVRVIAATHRNLEEEIAKGNFRSDLYYRLNVVYIYSPPLRERKEDILPLMEYFLSKYCQSNFKYITNIKNSVIEAMKKYPWPGNIRELENCMEKMIVMTEGDTIIDELLPTAVSAYIQEIKETPKEIIKNSMPPITETMSQLIQGQVKDELDNGNNTKIYKTLKTTWEKSLLEIMLKICNNNQSKTAKALGVTRNTLATKLNQHSVVKREWNL